MMSPDLKQTKARIAGLVRARRVPALALASKGPRFSKDDAYREGGSTYQRRVMILLSRGCSVPTCSMCPFTNYTLFRTGIQPRRAVEQIEFDLQRTPVNEPDIIAVYNDGSFFSDSELPTEERLEVAECVRAHGFKRLLVESLPQFLTRERLEPFVQSLKPTKLTVGVGLQSTSEIVRQVCSNASFGLERYESAFVLLKELGVSLKTYLMIKPPFLTESEAIADVSESCEYLEKIGVNEVTLCPTRVAPNTLVDSLFQAGFFAPPDLWTVAASIVVASRHVVCRLALQNLVGGDFSAVVSDTDGDVEARERLLRALRVHAETGALRLEPADALKVDQRVAMAAQIDNAELLERINVQVSHIDDTSLSP